jgi:hypothetical protein
MANPSTPILIAPPNDSTVVGNVIVFSFTVPSDGDNDLLVFRVELDIINPPSAANPHYKVNESRFAGDLKTNGNWQVKDSGGNYIQIPTAGIGSSFYGRDARVSIRKQDTVNYPDIDSVWYWRISAGDGMSHPVVFNRAIFAQAVFGVT